jgi:hypothetical protein
MTAYEGIGNKGELAFAEENWELADGALSHLPTESIIVVSPAFSLSL